MIFERENKQRRKKEWNSINEKLKQVPLAWKEILHAIWVFELNFINLIQRTEKYIKAKNKGEKKII